MLKTNHKVTLNNHRVAPVLVTWVLRSLGLLQPLLVLEHIKRDLPLKICPIALPIEWRRHNERRQLQVNEAYCC